MADNENQVLDNSTVRGRRKAAFDRDWTKGSIVRNLLSLSWPMIVTDCLNTIGPTIDMIWVGKLGAASIAGVGIASMALLFVRLGVWGMNTGMRAMVARFVGAGDTKGAIHVSQQTLVTCGAYATVMTIAGILFAEPILRLFGVEADVVSEGAAYMRIMFLGTAAVAFHQMTEVIMQSAGDAVTPMRISISTRVVHTILCPFLVFGWWIFPRLGVSGAAVTNVISLGLAMTLGLWVVFTGRSRLRVTLRNFRFDPGIIWRVVRIGIPATIMSVQWSLGRLVLMKFMIPFGTLAVAAHTLMGRIETFVTMPSFGFGRGAGVLVGQNLGAQQPGRAGRSAWLAMLFAEFIIIIFAVVALLWPGMVIRLFSPDPELTEISSVYLRIAAVGFVALGFNFVLEQCLAGAGDTLPPMVIEAVSTWMVILPLAYFLPRVTNLGVYGVRWSMVAGCVAAAVAFVVYFRVGRWKRKKV